MPYIPGSRRNLEPEDAGELNFRITREILNYLHNKLEGKPRHYEDYNEVIGVLRLVELELWDRLIRPYEKEKREENGDVF